MKAKFIILLLLLSSTLSLMAENQWDYLNRRNEIRIGWGDQLFESLMWRKPASIVTTMPATYQRTYKERFSYNQHLWAEYQWRIKHWVSIGGMCDLSEVGWNNITRDGTGKELSRSSRQYFYNIVLMPTVRFTYYHHDFANIYSGLGVGMCINGGTETNGQGHKTDIGAAVNITLLGVSANYNRWFWAVDFGGLYALKNTNTIFMASSRIINVSIGARF